MKKNVLDEKKAKRNMFRYHASNVEWCLLFCMKKSKVISMNVAYEDNFILSRIILASNAYFVKMLPFLGDFHDVDNHFKKCEVGVIDYLMKAHAAGGRSNQGVTVGVGALDSETHAKKMALLNNNVRDINKRHCILTQRHSKSGLWILGSSEAHPFFIFDLGNGRYVTPSAYTILDGNAGSAFRTWELQGSYDGVEWIVLRKHVNDERQPSNLTKGSWKILPSHLQNIRGKKGPLKRTTVPRCRFFRVVKDAPGSSNSYYLGISGFEVYGKLGYFPACAARDEGGRK